MSTSCAACTSSFGMLCRFSDTLFIHPKCGADVRTPPQYQMLSTSGIKKRYGSKKHVLSAIASRKCRTAAGPFRFGNQSEMYLVSEFEVVMKEEEMRLNVGKKHNGWFSHKKPQESPLNPQENTRIIFTRNHINSQYCKKSCEICIWPMPNVAAKPQEYICPYIIAYNIMKHMLLGRFAQHGKGAKTHSNSKS